MKELLFFLPRIGRTASRSVNVPKDSPRGYLPRISSWLTRRAPRNRTNRRKSLVLQEYDEVQTQGDSRKPTKSTAIPGEERNPLLYPLSLYPYSRRPRKMPRVLYGEKPTYLPNACVGSSLLSRAIVSRSPRDRGTENRPAPIISLPETTLLLAETYHRSFDSFSMSIVCKNTLYAWLRFVIKLQPMNWLINWSIYLYRYGSLYIYQSKILCFVKILSVIIKIFLLFILASNISTYLYCTIKKLYVHI